MELVESVYKLTQPFPGSEAYGLIAQMRRAAVSIPSNIAEGHSRHHLREYLHHASMAQGSVGELGTQVEIAARLKYLAEQDATALLAAINSLGRQLHRLHDALSANPTPNTQHPIPAPEAPC